MPQSPFDLLKQAAMRGVPQRQHPPTEMELENQAFGAQAKQDTDTNPFRKAGRHAIEALTGFFTDDPTSEPSAYHRKGITNPATDAGQLGGIANILPAMGGLKKVGRLPMIAPEAYSDVKAGGLKLYSRLTDTFAKAPAKMKPAKAISLAQGGASREEINLRKLNDFLKGRDPMGDINREEIMGHLASNPLELDVVRKGSGRYELGEVANAEQDLAVLEHELDTRYGGDWDISSITPEERTRHMEVTERASAEGLGERQGHPNPTEYDFLQTPGPSENYGESLVKLPRKNEALAKQTGRELTPEETSALDAETFRSGHFTDDPNTLVWNRHNDRSLAPVVEAEIEGGQYTSLPPGSTSKGRFVEEIQSDWHQQGREVGYRGDPLPPQKLVDMAADGHNVKEPYYIESELFSPPTTMSSSPDEAMDSFQRKLDSIRVPDAPFKDTYHELALKQQLLDAAEDPSLEWLGVADAETNRVLEGHPELRDGTRHWYDEKHPSALEKLLTPLGGSVEHSSINDGANVSEPFWRGERPSVAVTRANHGDVEIADAIPGANKMETAYNEVETMNAVKKRLASGGQVPGPGMWKANLTPELKQLIKDRGFPAMLAFMALQQSLNEKEQ